MHLHNNPICDVNQCGNILEPIRPDVDNNMIGNLADIDIYIFQDNDYIMDTNDNINENEIDIMDPNVDNSLMLMKYDFIKSFVCKNFMDQNMFNAQLDLIQFPPERLYY